MNTLKHPEDPLFEQARKILATNPGIGKNRLGALLGIKAPSARRRIVRWRGETEGHSTDPDYVRVRQLKEQHPEWGASQMVHALGISMDHAQLHLARWLGAQSFTPPAAKPAGTPPTTSRDNELEDTVHDSHRDLSYRGSKIQTLDELMEYARVDRSLWEVERHTLNKYEIAAKTPDGMATTTLFQIKAWLKRKVVEQQLQGVMDKLLQRFRDTAPFQPAVHYETTGRRGLLELSLMDLHLGKYCSALETGRSYNADITRTMFETALNDLLNKAAGLKYEKLLFVVGNDFFNTDHLGRTTTAGTPQDECMRYQESFAEGKALMVKAIDHLRTLAPVEVLMVSGNHDTQRLYYLGHALQERFHITAGVTVNNGMQPRKYVRYHNNLIGFTHGHNEKHHDLPLLLATEDSQGWAQSRHREFHLGHFHSRKLKMFVPSFDRAGVLVRILPSLCPPDAWHTAMGYNARLAAEALYFDPDEGCVATFSHAPN